MNNQNNTEDEIAEGLARIYEAAENRQKKEELIRKRERIRKFIFNPILFISYIVPFGLLLSKFKIQVQEIFLYGNDFVKIFSAIVIVVIFCISSFICGYCIFWILDKTRYSWLIQKD